MTKKLSTWDELAKANGRLRAELEAAKQDAARYGELRKESSEFAVMLPRKHGHIAFYGKGLDGLIDAALAAGGSDE